MADAPDMRLEDVLQSPKSAPADMRLEDVLKPPTVPQSDIRLEDALKPPQSQGTFRPDLHLPTVDPQAAAQAALVSTDHPILSRIVSGANAVTSGWENALAGTAAILAPKVAQQMQAAIPIATPTNQALPETSTLQAVGGTLPIIGASAIPGVGMAARTAIGAGVAAMQGAGQTRADIAGLREQGQQISGEKEAAYAGTQGVIQGGMALALHGVGGKIGGLIEGLAPEASAALRAGDASVLQHLTAQGLKMAGKAASGEVVSQAVNTASNLIKQGYDPKTALTQGWKENGILGAVLPQFTKDTTPGTGSNQQDEETAPGHQPSVEAKAASLPTKPTEADHESIRQAMAVHEQTLRQNTGVDQLSQLNDQAKQVNQEAATVPPVKPTAADHEAIRQAGTAFEQTTRQNMGVDKLADLNEQAKQVNQNAATGESPLLQNMKGTQAAREEGTLETPQTPAPVKTAEEKSSTNAPESIATPKAEVLHPGESTESAAPLKTLAGRLSAAKAYMADREAGTEAAQRSKAKAEFDTANFISQVEPYREAAGKLTDEQGRKWVESMDKHGVSTEPELKPLESIIQRSNIQTKERAAKTGLDTTDWRNTYIGFMAKKPSGMSDSVYSSKLAGMENYMKARKSATYEDHLAAIKAAGLIPAYSNHVDALMAKNAEINNSLSWREELQTAKDRGIAKVYPSEDDIPKGMALLPDRLGKDPYVTAPGPDEEGPKKGVLAVPAGFAKSIENLYANQGGGKSDLAKIIGLGRNIHYAADTFYAPRAFSGAAAHMIGRVATGDIKGAISYIPTAWKMRSVLKNLSEAGSDPTTKPLYDGLEQAAKDAGFRTRSFAKAPSPDDVKPGLLRRIGEVAHTVPQQIQEQFVQPLKAASMVQHIQYANAQGWSPEQVHDYSIAARKTTDLLFGAKSQVETAPPVIQALKNAGFPTWEYHTAGAKLTYRGLKDALTGKGLTPAAQGLIGAAVALAVTNVVKQAVSTKWNTGTAVMPANFKDLVHPLNGLKNPDGSEQRGAGVDTLTPLWDMIEQADKKGLIDASLGPLEPFVKGMAQFINGYDYNGKKISGVDRLSRPLMGAVPILPQTDKNATFGQKAASVAEQAVGLREAPKYVERSKKQVEAIDKRYNR